MVAAHRIQFDPAAQEHLERLSKRDQVIVTDSVDRQLEVEPTRETRNRKRMRPNPLAGWELRVHDDLRVNFDVIDEPEKLVMVRAVGVKKGNRVWIGRREVMP